MKFPQVLLACLAAAAIVMSTLSGVAAASGPNYSNLDLKLQNTYDSLRNKVAAEHNTFATQHRACKAEANKSWVKTAHTDLAQVKSVLTQLSHASTKQKKRKIFRDLRSVNLQLKSWAKHDIISRLGTCVKMPRDNSGIDNGFNTVDQDLGTSGGYS